MSKADIVTGLEMIIREGQRTTRVFTDDDWSGVVHDEEGGWSRKQVYCHLAATADITPGFLQNIAGAKEGEDAGAGFDITAFNAQQVAARESAPTDELMQSFESSYKQVIKAVEEMPDEQLTLKRKFGDFEGTVEDLILSVLILHGLSHIYISSTRAFV